MQRSTSVRAAVMLAATIFAGAASAQETFSITGTFKMNDLYPTVGADLEGVYNNGQNHWWRLTLHGVATSQEYSYYPYDNGGYIEQYITRLHAESFTFEFFGPDAGTLDAVVGSQLAGGSLPGGAFLELINGNYFDPDFSADSYFYSNWSLGLSPIDPEAGVAFATYPLAWNYWAWFPSDDFGFPLLLPQRLYPDMSEIVDRRNGATGALASYHDLVDLGSSVEPLPPPPPLQFDIANASKLEGNKGTSTLLMTVTLNRAATQAVSVSYQTFNGSAAAPKDYAATSGVLTFQPGETSKTISLTIKGDRARESNETFTVRLSNPNGALLGQSVGTTTILNDD